ncbi:MAG: DUF1080 domain-containing protein [Planctomycetaceae bacterium]|jgi:hypothetical protein|nr:DUF1080 domain-containing protein [Planctomycetaceae bacterium]MBT5126513.1 DUF1080 domain-containing protein [Planctomycetaceae bacterium]
MTKAIRNIAVLLVLSLVSFIIVGSTSAEEKWHQLFNGKNLDGWTPKIRGYELGNNFGNTFRVEDGVMKVGYEAYDEYKERFGHIFYKTSYSHYRMRLEYRFIGEQSKGGPGWAYRNSGIMIHGQSPESMTKDQKFPVSIEVQLLGGNAEGARTTSNLCTPGTNVVMKNELQLRHCISSSSTTYRGDRWVTAEIEVRGGGIIKHILDGKVVLQYSKPQLDPRDADAKRVISERKTDSLILEGGYISLQSESHPIEFRKVEILILDK